MNLYNLQRAASECIMCELSKDRKVSVFAKGNPKSSIMICGMCPGGDENTINNNIGLPFIGRSGRLLDSMLHDANLSQENVYITNVVKCFLTPGTRLIDKWIGNCSSYLAAQIVEVAPKVIIALGADAGRALLNRPKTTSLNSMRDEKTNFINDISIVVTYHPSYLLRLGGKTHRYYNRIIEDIGWAKEIVTND